MFFRGLTLSCWGCLQGHRAQKCPHENRPLYALKRKGRPNKDCQLLPLDANKPHLESFTASAVEQFFANILADPLLRDWYYHEEEPVKSPPTNCKKPSKTKSDEKKQVRDSKEMYGGSLTYRSEEH